jgi:hypothetical protein
VKTGPCQCPKYAVSIYLEFDCAADPQVNST